MYRNSQAKEPLKSHELRERPWQKIAVDLFGLDKQEYVVIVDYYSKFFKVSHLPNSKSKAVINHIKPEFARYEILEIIVSDNGPEFSSHEFAEFVKQYGFKHATSSPRYPQSNGLAERAFQTAENILKKAKVEGKDFQLGLLAYRNTPIEEIGLSPAQMMDSSLAKIDKSLPASSSCSCSFFFFFFLLLFFFLFLFFARYESVGIKFLPSFEVIAFLIGFFDPNF